MDVITKLAWKGLENSTFEHCTVTRSPGNILVQSKIEGPVNNVHTIVEYELRLTTSWIVTSVSLKMSLSDAPEQIIKLTHNKTGDWADDSLHSRTDLETCMDVDI